MCKSELRAALILVWMALTLVTAAAAAAPFLLPASWIERVTSACESKRRYGRPCFLCGATTAFIGIGRGDWRSARQANPLAPWLFVAFSANAGAAAAYLAVKARTRRRPGRETL
jgi:hypothetical protein